MEKQSPLDSMESWFKQMSDQFEAAAQRWGTGEELSSPGLTQPRIDMAADDEEYVIVADLPGFTKDDLNVYITDQTLAIDAEQTDEAIQADADYVTQERSHKSVSRRISLPSDADVDDITASMDNGVLTIYVAREEPLSSGHQIDID